MWWCHWCVWYNVGEVREMREHVHSPCVPPLPPAVCMSMCSDFVWWELGIHVSMCFFVACLVVLCVVLLSYIPAGVESCLYTHTYTAETWRGKWVGRKTATKLMALMTWSSALRWCSCMYVVSSRKITQYLPDGLDELYGGADPIVVLHLFFLRVEIGQYICTYACLCMYMYMYIYIYIYIQSVTPFSSDCKNSCTYMIYSYVRLRICDYRD